MARRRILLFPSGNNFHQLAVYLDVADSNTLPQGWSRQAHFTLTVHNHKDPNRSVVKGPSLPVPPAPPPSYTASYYLRPPHQGTLLPGCTAFIHQPNSTAPWRSSWFPQLRTLRLLADADHHFTMRACDWGFREFVTLQDLRDPGSGFLIDEKLVVSARVRVEQQVNWWSWDSKKERFICQKVATQPARTGCAQVAPSNLHCLCPLTKQGSLLHSRV